MQRLEYSLQPDRDHTDIANPDVQTPGSHQFSLISTLGYPHHMGHCVHPELLLGAFLTLVLTSSSGIGRLNIFTCLLNWGSSKAPFSWHLLSRRDREEVWSALACCLLGSACPFQFWLLAWTSDLGRVPLRLLALPTGWNPSLNSCCNQLWALGFHHCLVSLSPGPSSGLEVSILCCDRNCIICPVMWYERNDC